MKTTYELSDHANIHSNLAGGKIKADFQLFIQDGTTTILVPMSRDKTTALKRNLAMNLGSSGNDPTGDGFSISELSRLRREVRCGRAQQEEITEVIDAYIRLIEATAQEAEDAAVPEDISWEKGVLSGGAPSLGKNR